MHIVKTYITFASGLNKLRDIPLLLIRLTLANGFFIPAKMKWQNINSIADWFKKWIYLPLFLALIYLPAQKH